MSLTIADIFYSQGVCECSALFCGNMALAELALAINETGLSCDNGARRLWGAAVSG